MEYINTQDENNCYSNFVPIECIIFLWQITKGKQDEFFTLTDGFLHLFPSWERLVPSLGMKRSHVGNELFPRWEHTIRASLNNLKR